MQRTQGILIGLILGSAVTFAVPAFTQGPEERQFEQMRARQEMLKKEAQRRADEARERMRRAHAEQQERVRQIEQQQGHPRSEQARATIENLRRAAEFLDKAGKKDVAAQVRREAENLERELHRQERNNDPVAREVLGEIRRLREQIEHLQDDMNHLHERFDELTERFEAEDHEDEGGFLDFGFPGNDEKQGMGSPRFKRFERDDEDQEESEGINRRGGRGRNIQEQFRRKINQEGDFGFPEVKIPEVTLNTTAGVKDVAKASGDMKTESAGVNVAHD